MIEELAVSTPADEAHPLDTDNPASEKPEIVIVPFLGEGDEVVGRILGRLLEAEALGVHLLSWRTLRAEKAERLKELAPRGIVLSAIESRSAVTVGKMAHSIQQLHPGALIFVGLWSLPREGAARSVRKIKESSGSVVYTSLSDAVRGITSLISAVDKESPATVEAGERSVGASAATRSMARAQKVFEIAAHRGLALSLTLTIVNGELPGSSRVGEFMNGLSVGPNCGRALNSRIHEVPRLPSLER